MTYSYSHTVQTDDYYAFGMKHGKQYAETPENRNLFNRGGELNAKLGVYETFFRQYDPAIGRFNGIDIMAGKYSMFTPYMFSLNSPAIFSDPTGADASYSSIEEFINATQNDFGSVQEGQYTVGEDGTVEQTGEVNDAMEAGLEVVIKITYLTGGDAAVRAKLKDVSNGLKGGELIETDGQYILQWTDSYYSFTRDEGNKITGWGGITKMNNIVLNKANSRSANLTYNEYKSLKKLEKLLKALLSSVDMSGEGGTGLVYSCKNCDGSEKSVRTGKSNGTVNIDALTSLGFSATTSSLSMVRAIQQSSALLDLSESVQLLLEAVGIKFVDAVQTGKFVDSPNKGLIVPRDTFAIGMTKDRFNKYEVHWFNSNNKYDSTSRFRNKTKVAWIK